MSMFPTARLCECGSGDYSYEEFDARGIYLCRCCDECREHKLGGFRPEVLNDPDYECDEDFEPDWYEFEGEHHYPEW